MRLTYGKYMSFVNDADTKFSLILSVALKRVKYKFIGTRVFLEYYLALRRYRISNIRIVEK